MSASTAVVDAVTIFGELTVTFNAIACVLVALVLVVCGVYVLRASIRDRVIGTVVTVGQDGAKIEYTWQGNLYHWVHASETPMKVGDTIELLFDPAHPEKVVAHDPALPKYGMSMIFAAVVSVAMAYHGVKTASEHKNVAMSAGAVALVTALIGW